MSFGCECRAQQGSHAVTYVVPAICFQYLSLALPAVATVSGTHRFQSINCASADSGIAIGMSAAEGEQDARPAAAAAAATAAAVAAAILARRNVTHCLMSLLRGLASRLQLEAIRRARWEVPALMIRRRKLSRCGQGVSGGKVATLI